MPCAFPFSVKAIDTNPFSILFIGINTLLENISPLFTLIISIKFGSYAKSIDAPYKFVKFDICTLISKTSPTFTSPFVEYSIVVFVFVFAFT